MSKEPELSIKVSVDPVIDENKLKTDIQSQVDKVKELPKVSVDVNVGDFSKSLSDHMKAELKDVNKKLSYYLSLMTKNTENLNKAANNLFSDVDFSNKIQKQFDNIYTQFDQFKQQLEDTKEVMSSIFNDTNFLSVDDFEKSVSNVQKEIGKLYNKTFKIDKDHFKTDDFEKEFHNVIAKISPDLEKITKAIDNISGLSESNKDILKRLGMSEDDFMDATENISALGDSLYEILEFSKKADFSDKGIKSFFLSIGRTASEMESSFKSALSDVNELELSVSGKYKAIEAARQKALDSRKELSSGGFDKEKVNEMSQAYLKAMGVLVNQQRILNTTKRSTIELEDNLLTKTKEVSTAIGEEVTSLKSLFNEVSKSDIGKQLPAVSEYMKSKAELEASKNIESAKTLSLNVNSSSAKEYEAALKGIKDRISELGKEGAFDGLNNNIDENERAFINAKEYIKDYASALDEVKSKSRDTRLPQQRTTGLNVSNIENYSQKVTAIKNDLYALKDTVFPTVYSDINRTYGHLFDDSITNVQSYIDKLNEIPAAASSKASANRAPAKTQHNKNAETIDSTNIKNYAALLNGIQGAMNDMKTTIVPDFDKVLSENGKKIADIGASLVNYVAVLKRGLKAVDQSEKTMADKTAKKPAAIPAKNNVPAKNPTTQKIQDIKVTVNSNEVIVTGDPVNIPGKVELKDEDIKRPNPLNLNGAVKIKASDVKIDDVEISKKEFDIKGNLILKNAEIANAVKTATKEAAKEAQSKKPTAKTKSGLTDRDFERKSKELLTSLASIMKGKARIQNSLTNHTRKGQSEAAAEDSDYLSKLSRRERTTKSKLTKLYKGRGGRSAWEDSSIYHSAIEDSEHIRNSRLSENSDKDKAAEEEKYISALLQRSNVYKELAAARRKYGNDSEFVRSSQKELQDTLNIINQFESKVDNQYLQAMPERRKVFAENMSNLRKSRDDIRLKSTKDEFDLQQKSTTNYINQVVSAYGELDKLYKKKSRLTRPEDAKELDRVKTEIDGITQSIQDLMDAAEKAGTPIDGIKEVVDAFDTAADSEYFSHIDFNDKQKGEVISELTANYTSTLKQKYAYMTAQLKTENQAVFNEYQKLIDECDAKLGQYGKDLINNGKSIVKFSGLRAELSAKFHDVEDKVINNKISKIENDDAKKEQVYVSQLIKDYKTLTTLTTKRASLVKPEDADRLKDIDDELQRINARVRKTYALASKDGFNLGGNFDVQEQLHSLQHASKISKREFAKNQQQYNANQQTATIKKSTDLLAKYNQELTKQFRLYKELKQADPQNTPDLAAKQMAFDNQKTLVNSLRKEIHQKKLNTTSDYKQLTNQYNANVAGLDSVVDSKVVNAENSRLDKQIASYRTLLKEKYDLMSKIFNAEDNTDTTEWINRINEIKAEIDAGKQKLIGAGRQSDVDDLNKFDARLKAGYDNAVNKDANTKAEKEKAEFIAKIVDSYKQLEALQNQRVTFTKEGEEDELNRVDKKIKDITDDLKAMYQQSIKMGYKLSGNQDILNASAKAASAKRLANNRINKFGEKENQQLFDDYNNLIKRYQSNANSYIREKSNGDNPHLTMSYWEEMNKARKELSELDSEISSRGLWLSQQHFEMARKRALAEDAVTQALKNQVNAEQENNKAKDKDLISVQNLIDQLDGWRGTLEKDNNTDSTSYTDVLNIRSLSSDLMSRLIADPTNKDRVAIDWAKSFGITGINSFEEALNRLKVSASETGNEVKNLRIEAEKLRSDIKGKTEVANLKSQLMDYLEKFPKVGKALAEPVQKLQAALADPNAYKNAGQLKQDMAELRAQAKSLGLESENLIDKFEKLFGQHLSTMITMAALHKMQDALRIVYQNVVEIDTAMTELRKVTNLTASGYEEFMDRAADQAQKLGISISDFINSTADWARLGYDEQDAEELARVSSLLKNVGDGIESASDASSYLISGMQGFDLAADQASEFLDVLNQIANTEPVTANDLGVIMQKSAAAMNAAGNTYQETMAMAAAVNGVLQDNDVSGTYLKTLSMYLRAAKTDAENAGIEIDGMASSVSELRNELKQLTGVDIMSDAAGKNFKSTYQIMEELSKVWGSLSDVTQANVTELISGKRGGQATSALLNNFSVAEDAMKQAANATGSALAENAKYLDSIQGRLAQLDTSFQSLSTHVLDSGIVKYAVSFLTTIIKITDNITKLSGALPPIAAAVSGILSVMQMNGKLENGAGKVNMPAYARCA